MKMPHEQQGKCVICYKNISCSQYARLENSDQNEIHIICKFHELSDMSAHETHKVIHKLNLVFNFDGLVEYNPKDRIFLCLRVKYSWVKTSTLSPAS